MVLFPHLFHVTAAITDAVCGGNCDTGLPKTPANTTAVQTILQLVFGVAGGIAVFFVVYGGFKFVLSGGDPGEAGKAKQTILYAVIGLAVAVLAEAIVSLVIKTV